jgi:hypothetical protein
MRYKFRGFLITLFTLLLAVPCISQFKDFRPATVIKSNGDSLAAKINFKINFLKIEKVLIKTSHSKQKIPIQELKKIVLSTGEVYTVVTIEESTKKRVLAKTYFDGRIGLYKVGDLYYLKKDTNIYKLDDRSVKIKIDGQERSIPSKKHLSALNMAFMDCQTVDYSPLSLKANLKPLTNLVYQYGECKNIAVRNVARKPTIELAFSAGPSALKLNSSMIKGSTYNSGNGFFYELSFLKDFGPSNRLKMRLDVDYIKSEISSSFINPYVTFSGTRDEYISFSTAFSGLRLPMGLQYYFFNNKSSLYLSAGILVAINKYDDFNAKGYFVYDRNGTAVYQPSYEDHFEVTKGPIDGVWCAMGGDIRLKDRLRLNIELRTIQTAFDIYATVSNWGGHAKGIESVTVTEFNPSLGLKYRLR